MTVSKRKVIVVTDGDMVAKKAVEIAAKHVGARCISASAGNPTPLTGKQLVDLVKEAEHDPVVVMFDDVGLPGKGKGEQALEVMATHPDIEVLGAVAVASNLKATFGVEPDACITCKGNVVERPVNKAGELEKDGYEFLEGDTVEVLADLDIPVIIGMGDVGKQHGFDHWRLGAPITTKALREIIARGEQDES